MDVKSLVNYNAIADGISWVKLNYGVTSEAVNKTFNLGSDLTSGLVEIKIPRTSLEKDNSQYPEGGVEIEISYGSSNPENEWYYSVYYTIDNTYGIDYEDYVTRVPEGAWGLAIAKE